jgi:hypothetical protein
MPKTRPVSDYNRAQGLIEVGVSDWRIALRTGIPRSTVRDWRRRASPPGSRRAPRDVLNWRPPEPAAYAYLLGLFLGDGCLIRRGGASPQLVLTLDARYPEIIGDAVSAIRKTVPGLNVPRAARAGCIALLASHPVWATAFPQGMARGRKHQRRIELTDWQRELTHDFPTSLLRRLIHSDGCRSINRFPDPATRSRCSTGSSVQSGESADERTRTSKGQRAHQDLSLARLPFRHVRAAWSMPAPKITVACPRRRI